jgi:hydrogenase nickel incorporation protein HypB
MSIISLEVEEEVQEEDLRQARVLKEKLEKQGIRCIGLLGSPGCGKTTLLEHFLPKIAKTHNVAVIEGDVATDADAKRIESVGVQAVQIETNGACHMDVSMIERALSMVEIKAPGFLVIENIGNLICPIEFPLGEALRICVISTAEGEDKPLKYPKAVMDTDAVIISKTDIAKYVHADPKKMAEHVLSVNPKTRVFYSYFDSDEIVVEPADGKGGFMEFILK